VIKVSKALRGPDAGLQLIACDQNSGVLEQNLEHLERLLLELDAAAGFTNLSSVEIRLEWSEANRVVPVATPSIPIGIEFSHPTQPASSSCHMSMALFSTILLRD
jgi:hypothetical protein